MSMKIDGGMPNRISMNVTVPKQTQGATFGERVNAGLQAAGSAVAQGASLLGGALPGGAIMSAAVSSVTTLAGSPGAGGGAASAAYAATGVVGLAGGGGVGTTVGTPGGSVAVGSNVGSPNLTAGASANQMGAYNTDIASMSAQNSQMLQVQMAMQRENTMFSSISNVLKTKHDTAKNSIGNIR